MASCVFRFSWVDLHDCDHPWTETYEHPLKEVFALQSEITRTVAAR